VPCTHHVRESRRELPDVGCLTNATCYRYEISGKVPRFGGIALTRATLFRAFVLSAALISALPPMQCLGEEANQLPEKATRELSPELLSLLRQKRMPKHSPIILRVFKEEAELEVWKQDTTGHFQILKTYPICRWSGDLGPKMHEGDRQTPEGFYSIRIPTTILRSTPGFPTATTRRTATTAPS
jgi:hypothetical protein